MSAGKFVWTLYLDKMFPEKWPAETALPGATVALTKHDIETQAEFDLTLDQLAAKYPPPVPQTAEVAKGP